MDWSCSRFLCAWMFKGNMILCWKEIWYRVWNLMFECPFDIWIVGSFFDNIWDLENWWSQLPHMNINMFGLHENNQNNSFKGSFDHICDGCGKKLFLHKNMRKKTSWLVNNAFECFKFSI